MRWATFRDAVGERVGLVDGDAVHALEPGTRLIDLLGDRGEALGAAAEKARSEEPIGIAEVQLLAPVPRPPSVRDFYAFEQHVKTAKARRGLEMDPDWYELPVFYFTNPAAITGPNDDVAIPPGSEALDYELEVAAIVGKGGSDLEPGEAEQHIAGFCVMNDWSAATSRSGRCGSPLVPPRARTSPPPSAPSWSLPTSSSPSARAVPTTSP